MQILGTIIHNTIWGGERLVPYTLKQTKQIGHLYGCIDQSEMCSPVIFGEFKGKTLHDWFVANREKYHLEGFCHFPLVLALVDARENLSIQVHPDLLAAKKLSGPSALGKSESFYVIDPPTGGRMINGCKEKNKQAFIGLIREGKWTSAVDTLDVKKGDYVYVESGTVHAMTAGALSFEIEENSELTYRFYDFDRTDPSGKKRSLQIDQAEVSFDPSKKSLIRRFEKGKAIVEKNYSCQLLTGSVTYSNNPKEFSLLTLLEGEALIRNHLLLPGHTIILEGQDGLEADGSSWMLVKIVR